MKYNSNRLFKVFFLVYISLLSFSPLAVSQEGNDSNSDFEFLFHTPPFQNDNERLSFLVYIKDEIPDLFEKAVQDNTNLFDLLEKQERIQSNLQKDDNFKKLLEVRSKKLSRIHLKSEESDTGRVKVFDEKAIKAWRGNLLNLFTGIFKEIPKVNGLELKSVLLRKAEVAFQKLVATPNPSSLIGALIRFLDPEAKKQLKNADGTKKNLNEIIKVLKKHLPETLGETFKSELVGLAAGIRDKNHIIEQLEASRIIYEAVPNELRDVAEAYILLDRAEFLIESKDHVELKEKLQQTDAADLDTFTDKEQIENLLPKFANAIYPSDKSQRDKFNDITSEIIHQHMLQIEKSVIEKKEDDVGELIIEEVPPWIGIFRGCIGRDCATSNSYSYPNSPNERVYFIKGIKNNKQYIKGYASGTMVEDLSGRSKILYIHTINGRRISSADVRYLVEGLYRNRQKIGFDEIAFASDEALKRNVNFPDIRNEIKELKKKSKGKKVIYPDIAVRETLQKINRSSYDMAVDTVYPYNPNESLKLTAEFSNYVPADFKNRTFTKNDILSLAFDFYSMRDSADLDRILALEKIDVEEFKSFCIKIKNKEQPSKINSSLYYTSKKIIEPPLKINEYLQALSDGLDVFGFDKDLFFKEKKYLIAGGILNCPDAFELENLEKSVPYLIQSIEFDETNIHFSIINKYKNTLAKSEKLKEYFRKLSLGTASDVKILSSYQYQFSSFFLDKEFLMMKLKKLKSKSYTVRESAMNLLLVNYEPELIPLLTELLDYKEKSTRVIAACILQIYSFYFPELTESYKTKISDTIFDLDLDSPESDRIIYMIAQLDKQDPRILKLLDKIIHANNYKLLPAAIHLVKECNIQNKEFDDYLLKLLDEPQTNELKNILYSIISYLPNIAKQNPKVIAYLHKVVDDPENNFRGYATEALSKINEEQNFVEEILIADLSKGKAVTSLHFVLASILNIPNVKHKQEFLKILKKRLTELENDKSNFDYHSEKVYLSLALYFLDPKDSRSKNKLISTIKSSEPTQALLLLQSLVKDSTDNTEILIEIVDCFLKASELDFNMYVSGVAFSLAQKSFSPVILKKIYELKSKANTTSSKVSIDKAIQIYKEKDKSSGSKLNTDCVVENLGS